jgi:hypothetical protein
MNNFPLHWLAIIVMGLATGCASREALKGTVAGGRLTGKFVLDTGRMLEVRNAGAMINGSGAEYGPVISSDGKTFFFVRGSSNADIWSTTKTSSADTLFEPPARLGPPFNSPLNEGAMTISSDGQRGLFTACNRPDGLGDCDLYEVGRNSSGEPTMRNATELNSPEWDSQPSLSADGNGLYFVSNRIGAAGGLGDADIYISTRQADGRWRRPLNVGGPVNTRSLEESPCLAMGDSVLFFASNRPGGFGGFDIYASRRNLDGTWGDPVNLGPLFNSSDDDRFITVTADGAILYYSSRRTDLPHAGNYDIYMVRTVPAGSVAPQH